MHENDGCHPVSAPAPTPAIRVLIIDDHPVFRKGLVALLRDEQRMIVVAETSKGQTGIDLSREHQPDIVLLDTMLPDMSGDCVISGIRRVAKSTRIMILTSCIGDGPARRALAAGVQAYLRKTSLLDDLAEAVRAVHAGEHRIDGEVARQLSDSQAWAALSERELAVLRRVAAGLENKQIAQQLSLSPDTVKEYLSNAMSKLQANNRAHAVSIAQTRGFFR